MKSIKNSEFSVVSVDEKTVLLTLTASMMGRNSGSDGCWLGPPLAPRRRSSRPRTKHAWLRDPHFSEEDAECDRSCDGAGGGTAETDNPDSGEDEGSVRRS